MLSNPGDGMHLAIIHFVLFLEMVEKEARLQGKNSTSCNIYVPKDWEGKRVVVIRIE